MMTDQIQSAIKDPDLWQQYVCEGLNKDSTNDNDT